MQHAPKGPGTEPSPVLSTLHLLGFLALLIAIVALVYRPWEMVPFDILDFSETLPILRATEGPLQATSALGSYYADHGRWSPVSFAFIALNWTLFGDSPQGWMWMRVTILACCGLLMHRLLHRLGFSEGTAWICSILLVLASTSAAATIRLTGEPLALLSVLVALLLASHYQTTNRWRTTGLAIAILAAFAVMAKETMLLLAPFVFLFAATYRDGRLEGPRVSARDRWLYGCGALVAALTIFAILATVLSSRPDGYVAPYGSEALGAGRLAGLFIWILLPVHPASVDPALAVAAAFLFLSVLVLGLHTSVRGSRPKRVVYSLTAGLLALPLIGALTYVPWPRFESFYALPYFIGSLGLLALSLRELERHSRLAAGLGRTLCVLLLIVSATAAFNLSRREEASRRLDGRLVQHLASMPNADEVRVAVRELTDQPWQGTGPTLARYADAINAPGAPLPPTRDGECAEIREAAGDGASRGTVFVFSHRECVPPDEVDERLNESYQQLELRPPAWGQGRLTVSIVGP